MNFENLDTIIDGMDFIEQYFHFPAFEILDNTARLQFEISEEEGHDKKICVTMTALKCRDFYFNKDDHPSFYIIEEHPLLWRFCDEQADLYISSSPPSIEKTVFDLWEIHHSLFGSYLPFEPDLGILRDGYGLFLNGSYNYLDACSKSLEKNGIKNSVVRMVKAPKKADRPKMFMIARCYFIADTFEFEITQQSLDNAGQ